MAQFRRLSRTSPERTSLRRKSTWDLGPGDNGPLTAFIASGTQLTSGVTPVVEGITVVRIRGRLQLRLVTAVSSADGFHGAFGIGIITAAAFTAGVASVPTPITEMGWNGWLFHQMLSLKAVQPIAAAGVSLAGDESSSVLNMEVDTKAMRKFGSDMVLFGAIELTEVGDAALDWYFNTRALYKLP